MTERPVQLYSGLALQQVLERDVFPGIIETLGAPVTRVYEPTRVLVSQIADGARPDVMIGVAQSLLELTSGSDPVLAADTVRPLVRSGLGLAVPPGQALPDIGSKTAFVEALLSAEHVAYSATGASGVYFASLLEELDIADEVNRSACVVSKGFVAETLLDGRADLAVQQVVELNTIQGIRIAGPFPAEVQHYVELSIALAPSASAAAGNLYEALQSAAAAAAYRAVGLEPEGDNDE